MKPFSLEEYLANPSRKVVTRDGRNVKIICTDAKGDCPIIGLVDCKDTEIPFSFTEKGRIGVNVCDSLIDLFFGTEKHEGWVNVYKNLMSGGVYCDDTIYCSKEEAKKQHCFAIAKIEWEE